MSKSLEGQREHRKRVLDFLDRRLLREKIALAEFQKQNKGKGGSSSYGEAMVLGMIHAYEIAKEYVKRDSLQDD